MKSGMTEQQPSPEVKTLQRLMDALAAQRNNALNEAAYAQAQLAETRERITALEAELSEKKEPDQ